MAGESISIPILTPGADAAARNIKQVGNASAETAGKLDVAAASLAAWNAAALKSAKADSTLVQSKKAHAKADALLADAENVLAGKATQTTKLFADQQKKLDSVARTAENAAGGFSGLAGTGGISGGGMAALIGAGVALSPVIATVGVGLGGLALAALAAGKNSKILGQELAPLKTEFAVFGKQLQPVLLSDFAGAAKLAGTVLRDVEPVAAATGKALSGVFTQLDAEFRSPAWAQFFSFMETTAGPDVRLLGQNFVDLTSALPPLLEQLQPVSHDLLLITDAGAKLVGTAARVNQSFDQTGKHENFLAQITDHLRQLLFAPGVGLYHALKLLGLAGGDAGKGLNAAALGAIKAHAPFFDLNKATAALNASMTTLVGNLLTLQGDNVAWRQSMEAAKKQLDSNTAGLEGNSKNALANKQAVISSTNAAIQFASQQLTLGKNIDGASRTVQAQIKWLESLHSKSSLVKQELEALRKEEKLLQQQRINQTVNVQGLGQWSVSQSLAPGAGHRRAAGGMIPGSGNADNYPALLTPGEVVVPKGMVSAGAVDHLRGRLPGFASGGLVPNYSGAVGGVWPWIKMNDTATIRLMDQAIARATVAGMRAAASAASGFGRGHPLSGAGIYSQPALEALWTSAGGPASLAHLMAAIADAESGGKPNAFNPSGASGLWQILGQIVPGNIFNPFVNAENAVAKYRSQGLGAWVTYTNGAYKQYYDNGGLLMPGVTVAVNNTGRPEQVIPARGGRGGGTTIIQNISVGHGTHPAEAARQIVDLINTGARAGVKIRRSAISANG